MGLFSQNNSRIEEILGFSRSRGAVKNHDTLAGRMTLSFPRRRNPAW
jgi:hypothetical protein